MNILKPGVEVFVSSDGRSISGGREWFEQIKYNLRNSDLMIVLCSEKSVKSPLEGSKMFFESNYGFRTSDGKIFNPNFDEVNTEFVDII